jgi:photosystem II stability/assembly factor-like uncharacterized protein
MDPLTVFIIVMSVLAGGGAPVVARIAGDEDRWHPVWKNWGQVGLGTHFVTVDPSDPSIVWAGGELAAFQPFLVRSDDGGETWSDIALESDGDNAIYALSVDPGNSDLAFAGWEGQVKRTVDGDRNWETVLRPEAYPYFFGAAMSPSTLGRVYAAGARNDSSLQDLVLRVSEDSGETWSSIREEGGGGVLAMLVTPEDQILLGTQDGVYRVRLDE